MATERLDQSNGESWRAYCEWAKIPGLAEVVSLDSLLCRRLIEEFIDEDWEHNVREDSRLDYFYYLDYLRGRWAWDPIGFGIKLAVNRRWMGTT
jgi:hypothetical protein